MDGAMEKEEEENFTCFCQPKLADHMCPKAIVLMTLLSLLSQGAMYWGGGAMRKGGATSAAPGAMRPESLRGLAISLYSL